MVKKHKEEFVIQRVAYIIVEVDDLFSVRKNIRKRSVNGVWVLGPDKRTIKSRIIFSIVTTRDKNFFKEKKDSF